MHDIFEKDKNTVVYGEFSRLSSLDVNRIRLNPLEEVSRVIYRDRAGLIVLKPLVESQNILKLLDHFPGSLALWMYRNYSDVVASHIKRWGNDIGFTNLMPLMKNESENWRAEGISSYIRDLIKSHYTDNIGPSDACTLFWVLRNSIYFQLNLDVNDRVLICKYEDLVTDPLHTVKEIYGHLERPFPGKDVIRDVHTTSLGRGDAMEISPEIKDIADHYQNKLDVVYRKKMSES